MIYYVLLKNKLSFPLNFYSSLQNMNFYDKDFKNNNCLLQNAKTAQKLSLCIETLLLDSTPFSSNSTYHHPLCWLILSFHFFFFHSLCLANISGPISTPQVQATTFRTENTPLTSSKAFVDQLSLLASKPFILYEPETFSRTQRESHHIPLLTNPFKSHL